MRALTLEELQNIYGADGTSTVIVTAQRPPPNIITDLPVPPPSPPQPAPSPPAATPMAPTPPCTSPANAVNASYIYAHELGPGQTIAETGYYPPGGSGINITINSDGTGTVTMSPSGMTVGYGVDLGQLNSTQLSSYLTGLGTIYWPKGALGSQYNALLPYVGVRNGVAIAAIQLAHGGPPKITGFAASSISTGALLFNIGRAANDYQSATASVGLGSDVSFQGLSAAVQTALTDITYVFGSIRSTNPDLPSGLYDAIGNQEWDQVATLLINAPQSVYEARLNADGAAIQQSVSEGKTPRIGQPCK
jgi:hypothetical protein